MKRIVHIPSLPSQWEYMISVRQSIFTNMAEHCVNYWLMKSCITLQGITFLQHTYRLSRYGSWAFHCFLTMIDFSSHHDAHAWRHVTLWVTEMYNFPNTEGCKKERKTRRKMRGQKKKGVKKSKHKSNSSKVCAWAVCVLSKLLIFSSKIVILVTLHVIGKVFDLLDIIFKNFAHWIIGVTVPEKICPHVGFVSVRIIHTA